MNIIPWRRRAGPLMIDNGFEDAWKGFWEPFEDVPSHLPATFQTRNVPPMNVSETEREYLVSIELPGLDAEDVNVELMGNQLQVFGERKWEEEKKDKEFHRVESQYGSFSRSFSLPDSARVDRDAVEATFNKGVLEIKIPKLEPTPTAKIKVKAKSKTK